MNFSDFVQSRVPNFHNAIPDCPIKPENGLLWTLDEHDFDGACLHHSGTFLADNPKLIRNYHVNTRGWTAIAYHLLITKAGLGHICKEPKYRSAHCGNSHGNKMYLAICLEGNFTVEDPTAYQLRQLSATLEMLEEWKGGPIEVVPHKLFVATACPGNLMEKWEEYEEKKQAEAERRWARWLGKVEALE